FGRVDSIPEQIAIGVTALSVALDRRGYAHVGDVGQAVVAWVGHHVLERTEQIDRRDTDSGKRSAELTNCKREACVIARRKRGGAAYYDRIAAHAHRWDKAQIRSVNDDKAPRARDVQRLDTGCHRGHRIADYRGV